MITKKSFTGLTAPHQQCELMDAASEQKRFPETDQVLAYDDFNLQTIFEYIQITLFKIVHVGQVLAKFEARYLVFMDTSVLEWLGYDHEASNEMMS